MRPKTMLLFVVAIGCGLVASIGVSQYMEKANRTGPKLEMMKVYVAAHEINVGDKLDDKSVKLLEWPKDRMPEDAVMDFKDLEGKYTRSRLFPGEPILKAKLTDSGRSYESIPEGYRVVSVKVTIETAGGGLIRPGDHVDLIVFLRRGPEVPESKTHTLLRDVNVFAVNAETERQVDATSGQMREARTVSLLVKAKQAEAVLLATELGPMSLVLRRPGDAKDEASDGQTLSSLLGQSPENAAPKPATNKESGKKETGIGKLLTGVAQTPPVKVVPQQPQPPAPPANVEPPKHVMKIRTLTGERKYVFRDLDGEPEVVEEGEEEEAMEAPVRGTPAPFAPRTPVNTAPAPATVPSEPATNVEVPQNELRETSEPGTIDFEPAPSEESKAEPAPAKANEQVEPAASASIEDLLQTKN